MDKLELLTLRVMPSETPGKVWITKTCGENAGEGGEFDVAELERVIAKFYEEHF